MSDITILKTKCEKSIKQLKKCSLGIIEQCEQIINICNERKNMFGAPKDEIARVETVDLCFKKLKSINEFAQKSLDAVLTIYSSVLKYNELASTPLYNKTGTYSSADIFSSSYFFTLANEIGNVFEDLFEADVPRTLNNIVEGLDLDSNGEKVNMNLVIANAKIIANIVSKATNYYLKEV